MKKFFIRTTNYFSSGIANFFLPEVLRIVFSLIVLIIIFRGATYLFSLTYNTLRACD